METDKKNIVLIGMPGAGKSTLAKYLAQSLKDYSIIDTDTEIEKRQNMSISDIFALKKENYFRELEKTLVKEISEQKNLIISTGGGTFEAEENRINLKKNGIIYFIDCDIDIIYQRIKSQTQRPLLLEGDLKENLHNLYKKRIEKFLLADIIIKANNSAEQTAKEVLKAYNGI